MTTIGSVCTGYGGLDAAVLAVFGGEVAWVADNDEGASLILAHRFPAVRNLGDITAADWSTVGPVDIFCAGTPCQDVSAAGARTGLRHGTRSGVWHEAVRAIAALRPQLVVIENVLGLLTARGDEPTDEHLAAERTRDAAGSLLEWLENEYRIAVSKGDRDGARNCLKRAARVMGCHKRAMARCRWHERRLVRAIGTVLGTLASLGFDAEWTVLSAADAGSCHLRKRVFILAWPAADADRPGEGRRELPSWRPGPGRRPPGGGQVPADPECERREGHQPAGGTGAVRAVPETGRRGPAGSGRAAAHSDGPTRIERRESAPGQAEGGRPRADAGRRAGAPAAHAECHARAEDEQDGSAAAWHRDAAADSEGDGRDEGRPEPAWIVRRPDAALGGDGTAPDADGSGRGPGEHGVPAREPDAGRGAPADAERRGRDGRPQDAGGGPVRGTAARRDSDAPANADSDGLAREPQRDREPPSGFDGSPGHDPVGRVLDWGPYGPAIRRWEAVLGHPAPRPTEPGRTGQRLSPRFVEWMQGLPDGWVTDVPGLSRNAQLKALGNGVVPQQAILALTLLLERAGLTEAGEAA